MVEPSAGGRKMILAGRGGGGGREIIQVIYEIEMWKTFCTLQVSEVVFFPEVCRGSRSFIMAERQIESRF